MTIWMLALMVWTLAGQVQLLSATTADVHHHAVRFQPNQLLSQGKTPRKVTIHPSNATCGSLRAKSTILPRPTLRYYGTNGDTVYRQVATLQRATQSYPFTHGSEQLDELLCVNTPCPGRKHPVQHIVQQIVPSTIRIGNCSNIRISGPNGRHGRTVSDQPRCAVKLDQVVTPDRFTLTFWVRAANPGASGTLIEISTISIMVRRGKRSDLEVRVSLPGCSYNYQVKEWSSVNWNHITLQIDHTSRYMVRLYINGRSVDLHGTVGSPSNTVSKISWVYLGARHAHSEEYHTFDGELSKVKLYHVVLTEREINQLYSDVFETVPGPFKDCLCPEKFPFLNRQDHGLSCCAANDCQDSDDTVIRQTFGMSAQNILVGPEAVVDGAIGPYVWISTPGVTRVSLDIDLGMKTEIDSVEVVLFSPPPEEGLVLYFKQRNNWVAWHYFTFNCSNFGPINQDVYQHQPTCEQLGRIQSGQSVWNLTWRRPLKLDLTTAESRETDTLRVTILGFPSHDGKYQHQRLQYHVISEIKIIERSIRQQRTKYVMSLREGSALNNDLSLAPRNGPTRRHELREEPEVRQRRMKRQSPQPEVYEVIPSFGPPSGDLMTIRGTNFDSNVIVTFRNKRGASLPCSCLEEIKNQLGCNTNERISCYVSIPPGPATLNREPFQVHVINGDGTPALTNENHTYTPSPSPRIFDIFPRTTFISGGLQVAVVGEHLTSFLQPRLILSVTYWDRAHKSGTPTVGPPCNVINDTNMFCRVPQVNLPAVFKSHIAPRQRRSIDLGQRMRSAEERAAPLKAVRKRVKRQDFLPPDMDLYLNDNSMNVDIGVVLGGATVLNITEEIQDVMLVARDPRIHKFSNDIYEYRLFPPYNEEVLKIEGESLNLVATVDHYTVTVGEEPCEVVDVKSDVVYCKPPNLTERLQNGRLTINGDLLVMVAVGNLNFKPGYVRYLLTVSQHESSESSLPAIIGAIVAVLLIVVVLLIIGICCWKHKLKVARQNNMDYGPDYTVYLTVEKSTLLDLLEEELRRKIADCTILPKRLSREKEIGQGNFGKVFLGKLSKDDLGRDHGQNVAVKTIRDEGVSLRQLSEFLEEATIMKDFDHPNVLSLLGVVIEANRPYVLLPFMANGDLRIYVSDKEKELSVHDLLILIVQVCNGMVYLSRQKFVHRDLRAVNCMVDENVQVKVGDFGLARDMHHGDYYKVQDQMRPLPVKWMAPESLSGGVFSSSSDVWSFGVVKWEVLTRGLKPYADIDNYDIRNYIVRGYRLPKPDFCPHKVYDIMHRCWSVDPSKRPTFVELDKKLTEFMEEIKIAGKNEAGSRVNDEYIVVRRPQSVISAVVPNEYVERPSYQGPENIPLEDSSYSYGKVDAEHEDETDLSSHYVNTSLKDGDPPTDTDTPSGPGIVQPSSSNTDVPHNQSRNTNPYFVNPPIRKEYINTEGMKKLDKSANVPRGLLVDTFPEQETERDDTKAGPTGPETEMSERNQEEEGTEVAEMAEEEQSARSTGASGAIQKRGADYINQPGIAVRQRDEKK